MNVYTYNQLYFQYKKLYSNYLKKLILILNTVHKKNYNQDYWEPIIGIYLRRFILNYIFLKKVSKKKSLYKKINLKNINFFRSYREYSNANDDLALNKINFHKIETHKNFGIYRFKRLNLLTKIINSLKSITPNILLTIKISKILFYESYFKKTLKKIFSFKSAFYFYPLPFFNLENYSIEKKEILQNRLDLIKKNELKFKKDMLLKNIFLLMPVNYIENYKVIYDEIEKLKLSEGIYIDGNEVSFDFIKFYIAKLKLNKKKVLTGQHSFRTGIDDYDVFFDYSKSISNYFLTWGWTDKSDIIKKFSSLRVFSSLDKYEKVKKIDDRILKICFILCSYSKLGECLYDNLIENQKAERTRIAFLKDIKKQKKIKIFLKPRSGSFLLNKQRLFYNKFNILKDKTRMYDVFGKFSIVIFERLSLGIVENILLNQPTIFYYPKILYQLKNRHYKDLVYLLKKANIFFDDKKKIQKIINSKKTISKWWLDKKNIKNRNLIIKKYANSFNYDDFKVLKNYLN